ncbi:hypothetical protein F5Y09DRAFT_348174 [Xylaria sp. FL1042]|nr:hypothetical protein F5Y09DRAFT_348174 [Xylaria sp. FL1042]
MPLYISIEQHQFGTAAVLLKHGGQINLLNALGRPPLHEAIPRSDAEVIKFLVRDGTDPNARSEEQTFDERNRHGWGTAGILPLHEATRAWNDEAVKLLVQGGADVSR